jgi:hypothetical protein
MTTDLAYLAGFLDGEGCICIRKLGDYERYDLFVEVSQVNPAPLFLFERQFGGRVFKMRRHNEYRDLCKWRVGSHDAARVLQKLRPFLVVKAEEADLAIEFQRGFAEPIPKTSAAQDAETARRKSIYEQVQQIKHRSYELDSVPSTVVRTIKNNNGHVLSGGTGSRPHQRRERSIKDPVYHVERLTRMWQMRDEGHKYDDIAAEFSISRSRVCQLLLRNPRPVTIDIGA